MKNITNNNSAYLLETIFKKIPVGITVENKKGFITHANKSAAEIFGYNSEQELIGENIKHIFGNYKIIDDNGIRISLRDRPASKIFAGLEEVSEVLHFIDKKNGTDKWLLVRASAVKISKNKTPLAVKSFKDITPTIEEQKRRELFLGVVSHELKNPLASIKAYTQLLLRKEDIKNDSNINKYLTNIDSQTDRLTQIINDYLDLTRLTNGKFELNIRKFNPDDTIDKTIADFLLTTKTHHITRTGKIGINTIGDEDRIIQVIINLLSNAVEHSHKGNIINVKSEKDRNFIYISVLDYGVGIPKKYQNEIFKLFRTIPKQTGKKSSGLGMGLYISQAIIKSHGGEIILNSKVNKGAEFIVKLPKK